MFFVSFILRHSHIGYKSFFTDDFLFTGEILQILKFYFVDLLLNEILFLRGKNRNVVKYSFFS